MGCWISPWPPLHIAGYLPMGIFPNHDRLSGKCGLATPSRTGVRFFHLGIRQNLGTVKGVNGWTCEIFLARDARKTYDHRQANLRARGLFAKDEFSGHNRRLEAVGWCGDRHFMISCLWSWFRCNDASTLIQHELGSLWKWFCLWNQPSGLRWRFRAWREWGPCPEVLGKVLISR